MTWLALLLGLQITWASPRTVMVQLFEWPWADIARECEMVLGPQGFSAVQVSPPQEHLVVPNNPWWERYQPVSYKIISRSGDERAFRDMVRRCKASGVDIYVDAVLNHMAGMATGEGFAGTRYSKYHHDGLYERGDFHDCGRNGNNQIVNFKDRYELQFCELLGLADLKTESETVRDTLADYLNHLLDLGVAGFRLDSAKHIPAADIQAIISRLKRSAYVLSETFIGYDEPVTVQEYMPFGDINYFPYAFDLGAAFLGGRLNRLPQLLANYPDSRSSVVFVENHDLQRMGSTIIPRYREDAVAYQLENVFMLTWPYGYPQVYSGYAFQNYDEGPPQNSKGQTTSVLDADGRCRAPWNCEHRAPWISALVRFRNETDRVFTATHIYKGNESQIAFSRSRLGFVAINRASSVWNDRLPTDLPDGAYCNLLDVAPGARIDECAAPIVVSQGFIQAQVPAMSAWVLLGSARVSRSAP